MNVDLATRAIEAAKAHPDNFNMDHWWSSGTADKTGPDAKPPCGTTACYAGFASLLAAPQGSSIKGGVVYLPDQTMRHVEDYASEALDITREQAGSLFYLRNIEQVERAVKYLADNPDADEAGLWHAAGGTE